MTNVGTNEKDCDGCGRNSDFEEGSIIPYEAQKRIMSILQLGMGGSIHVTKKETERDLRSDYFEQYIEAIALLWWYLEWQIDRSNFDPEDSLYRFRRWKRTGSDMLGRIFEWWIKRETDVMRIMVNHIVLILIDDSLK